MKLPAVLCCLAFVASGCGADDAVVEVTGADAAPGISVAVVHRGLVGPTQLIVIDEQTFMVATINGDENEQNGQVLRIDTATDEIQELRTDLDKPTGIALLNNELWVMERDRLSRGTIDGEPVVVADNLPNNGRSQGTLTVTPADLIMFDTSGSKRGATVVDGSGRLFTVDPAETPGSPTELASGFKHAYAHVFDDAGVLWSTEMTDGLFDETPAPDELLAVVPGADHGWPRCVGDNRPVAEYGGTAAACASVPGSTAIFDPGATPTSVVVSPFEPDTLLVALWNEGRIVRVNVGDGTDSDSNDSDSNDGDSNDGDLATFDDVVTGLAGPQHLVATEDAVYVTEYLSGNILKLTLS